MSSQISDAEAITLLSLTVTGTIDSRDFACIRDRLRLLNILDLSGSVINTYTGTDGTNSGTNTMYPANELPMYAFYNPYRQTSMSTLTSLKFPSSIVSIGYLACYFCWNLAGQISIPATVKNITDNAFYGCYSLTAFSVSGSNTRYSGSNGVLFSKNQDTLFVFPNAKASSYTIPSHLFFCI
ncbi:MAG: leucine-rich repeat protein [Bacteroidia bacterium]|nr:leucine-rich repeat protein [Bacteroidia bacterium]